MYDILLFFFFSYSVYTSIHFCLEHAIKSNFQIVNQILDYVVLNLYALWMKIETQRKLTMYHIHRKYLTHSF